MCWGGGGGSALWHKSSLESRRVYNYIYTHNYTTNGQKFDTPVFTVKSAGQHNVGQHLTAQTFWRGNEHCWIQPRPRLLPQLVSELKFILFLIESRHGSSTTPAELTLYWSIPGKGNRSPQVLSRVTKLVLWAPSTTVLSRTDQLWTTHASRTCRYSTQAAYPQNVSGTDQLWTRAVHATEWNTGEKVVVNTGSCLDREVLISVRIRAAVVPKREAWLPDRIDPRTVIFPCQDLWRPRPDGTVLNSGRRFTVFTVVGKSWSTMASSSGCGTQHHLGWRFTPASVKQPPSSSLSTSVTARHAYTSLVTSLSAVMLLPVYEHSQIQSLQNVFSQLATIWSGVSENSRSLLAIVGRGMHPMEVVWSARWNTALPCWHSLFRQRGNGVESLRWCHCLMWELMWNFNSKGWEKAFPHTLHAHGLSLEWVRLTWLSCAACDAKAFPQCLHCNRKKPVR